MLDFASSKFFEARTTSSSIRRSKHLLWAWQKRQAVSADGGRSGSDSLVVTSSDFCQGEEYLLKIPTLPEDGVERLKFFQQYLEDEDSLLARDAYDEFAITPI